MNFVRKTYVKFLYLGSSLIKDSTHEVNTRDVSKLEVPKDAFGFRFFDILSVVVDADGREVKLTSEQINISPMHYYGGKIYTIAELKREFPNNDIKGNGYKKVIHCRTGNWQLFEETDIFIEAV